MKKILSSKILWGILGLLALYLILKNYGTQNLIDEVKNIGFEFIPLILTFIPTLLCYSIAWRLSTDTSHINSHQTKKLNILTFFNMSAISIAWNNLTPFVKIAGEPIKVMTLEKFIPRHRAISSVVIYNIIHVLGTILSMFLGALLIPILFNTSKMATIACFAIATIFIVMFFGLNFISKKIKLVSNLKLIRKILIYLRWSSQKMHSFYKRSKPAFIAAITFEVVARFIEGITFYYAFAIINKAISLKSSFFLEVGRALFDNVFFFIPYQVGAREGSLQIFMSQILAIPSNGYLTATLLYRFVEISWVMIGFLLWIFLYNKKGVKK